MPASTSKWTAFILSACVPGAGQLAAGSWTCLGWFAATGIFIAGWTLAGRLGQGSTAWLWSLQVGTGVALSLLSAEHAKRLLEKGRESGERKVLSSLVRCGGGKGRNLDILVSLDVARSRAVLWQIIRDLPRFLVIDPFHDQVTLMREEPAVGVDLVLSHNAFGRRFLRFGRIIAWQEGSGYTFSDLSARGPRNGFPHVFMTKLDPLNAGVGEMPLTRLSIRVRGRWTSRLVPVWLGRLWVWLVCREHARLLRKAL